MTRKKKPATRKTRSTSRARAGNTPAKRLKRFLKPLIVSALASFGVATCAYNPHWLGELPLDEWLSQWGGARQEQVAPVVVPSQGHAQTSFSQCPQFFPERRAPVVPAAQALRELCYSSFAILHSGQTKTPVFVAQRLNRRMLEQARAVERAGRFFAEARLPKAERAELDDYRNSGYSRGHMAPAADMASAEAMTQSFSLANMVPQDQAQNAGPWSHIEQDTRSYVMRASGDVYVFTGPVYTARPKTIGEGRVAVPNYLFKLVYDPQTGRSWAHWQANSPGATVSRPISYEELKRRTGLDLVPQARN